MRLVVLGTDTGVGKTHLGCALLQALRQAGTTVAASKPVESGAASADGSLTPADAIALRAAAGNTVPLDVVCPWAMPRPVTPAEELERNAPDVRLEDLVEAARRATRGARVGLVETAGGVHSPLVGVATSVDLAAQLRAPALLVTRDRLGTISATSTAIQAIRAAGVSLIGCVLNRWVDAPEDDVSVRTNAAWLARMHPDVPVFSVRGHVSDTLLAAILDASNDHDGSAAQPTHPEERYNRRHDDEERRAADE
jgi:dethiobiotin synthetase